MYDYGTSSIMETMTGGVLLVYLALMLFMIIAYWRLFNKAGEPGWAILIPIYNVLIMLKIAGKPWWWIFFPLLSIIPLVGWIAVLVISIFVMHGISVNFGKDSGFTVGLVLLPIVFIPILAFGDAQYMDETQFETIESMGNLED